MMSKKGWKCTGMAVFIPLVVALHSYAFMWLWNVLITDIFSLRVIDFWEALGLVAMAKLLFMTGHRKGGCGCGNNQCSSSPKQEFKNKLKDHFTRKYCDSKASEEQVD